jgi:hypothetical protein
MRLTWRPFRAAFSLYTEGKPRKNTDLTVCEDVDSRYHSERDVLPLGGLRLRDDLALGLVKPRSLQRRTEQRIKLHCRGRQESAKQL